LSDRQWVRFGRVPVVLEREFFRMFDTVEISEGKGRICRDILISLPQWFGIPEAIDDYVRGVENQPMLVCRKASDGLIVGFLSLRFHTAVAAEVYVVGVRSECHRQGCGTMLFAAAVQVARSRGARFLTVKTIAAGNPSPHYALTRQFYERSVSCRLKCSLQFGDLRTHAF
jgi:GNAT superfamily N-acetyltransferase